LAKAALHNTNSGRAARATFCVCGGGTMSACGMGLGCTPGGDEACDVRHVHEEKGAEDFGALAMRSNGR